MAETVKMCDMNVSIPLRYGTTRKTVPSEWRGLSCQFLLGTVQHRHCSKDVSVFYEACQFLLGTVQPKI